MKKLVLLWLLLLSFTALAQRQCPASSSGLVTLALPNSRFPVKDAADALQSSPHPSFAFVLRAFGTHYENVPKLITAVRNRNPSGCLTVLIYGDCGPCRSPRRPRGLFQIILPEDSISSLNRKLERGDKSTLNKHLREYTSILPTLPQLSGVRYIFMPALEDNYTPAAFRVLESLAKQVYSQRPDISVGRNPLSHRREAGIRERHTYSLNALDSLKPGDIITGDGEVLCLPGQSRCSGYSLAHVRRLTVAARARNIHFLVWLPETQGLSPFIGNNPQFIPVSKRRFSVPGIHYIRQLLK